jgi:hypothetical protein
MTSKDGNEILIQVEDFINTELKANNTMTKYNGTAFGQTMVKIIGDLVKLDANKELLWNEIGEKWLREKKEKEENEKNKKDIKNIIDANKTISSKLLDEKLKSK